MRGSDALDSSTVDYAVYGGPQYNIPTSPDKLYHGASPGLDLAEGPFSTS
jgi:hypothetical protein